MLAAFAALDGVSILWAIDLEEASKELAFFIFPFAALLSVVARSPFARWLPRALAVTLVGLAVVFSAIGLWQEQAHTVFFAHDLRVANTYTTLFRVTSVFKDPSIYGRHLVLAISVLLVLLWLGRVRFLVAAPIVATRAADRLALWRIVHEKCVPDEKTNALAAPCESRRSMNTCPIRRAAQPKSGTRASSCLATASTLCAE